MYSARADERNIVRGTSRYIHALGPPLVASDIRLGSTNRMASGVDPDSLGAGVDAIARRGILVSDVALRLCDDFQPLPLGVETHFARLIEEHRCAGLGGVFWPIRQARVIGISCPCEVHPGVAQLLTQDESAGIACAVLITDFGVVKREGDFAGVERSWTLVQNRRTPGINVGVRGRRT